MMLRRPKKAYWVPQSELDLESGAKNTNASLDQNFDDLLKNHESAKQDQGYDHNRSTANFQKANVKNTESTISTVISTVQALRGKDAKDGLDLEATTQKLKYLNQMKKARFLE